MLWVPDCRTGRPLSTSQAYHSCHKAYFKVKMLIYILTCQEEAMSKNQNIHAFRTPKAIPSHLTFVQSGMPPRLPAHYQCMLSHDISACSATWSLTAQSRDQRLSVTWSPYDKNVISERPATWSLHGQSGVQFLISHLISACTVHWSAPVSHWSLPDKHVISARTATSSVHTQSRDCRTGSHQLKPRFWRIVRGKDSP